MCASRTPEPAFGRPFGQIRVEAGYGNAFWAKVDLDDHERLSKYLWQLTQDRTTRYAQTRWGDGGHRRTRLMARMLLGEAPFPGARIRYINGDGLDCRRSNLKWATQSEVLANRRPAFNGRSRFKGVAWDESAGKWVARFQGRTLGRTMDEVEADRR